MPHSRKWKVGDYGRFTLHPWVYNFKVVEVLGEVATLYSLWLLDSEGRQFAADLCERITEEEYILSKL